MHQHLMLNGGTDAGTNWDAYVQGAHASRAAEYLLRSGFTSIRDIAGNSLGIKRAVNSGILPGPRIYSAGPALGPTGGHSDWGSWVAAEHGIYHVTRSPQTIAFSAFGGDSPVTIHEPDKTIPYLGRALSLSADGKRLLFSLIDHSDDEVMVVEQARF